MFFVSRFEQLNSIEELDASAPLKCLDANLIKWGEIMNAPKQAALKSSSRSPHVQRAVEQAEHERHIRDLATQAFAKLHSSHSRHAAQRHIRLNRTGRSLSVGLASPSLQAARAQFRRRSTATVAAQSSRLHSSNIRVASPESASPNLRLTQFRRASAASSNSPKDRTSSLVAHAKLTSRSLSARATVRRASRLEAFPQSPTNNSGEGK